MIEQCFNQRDGQFMQRSDKPLMMVQGMLKDLEVWQCRRKRQDDTDRGCTKGIHYWYYKRYTGLGAHNAFLAGLGSGGSMCDK